jgi:hypothetical protein
MESGLKITPTATFAGGATIVGDKLAHDNAFFVCNIVFPTSFAEDCVLYEKGGSNYGTAVSVVGAPSAPKLRIRAGNGSQAVPNDLLVFAEVDDLPMDGESHEVAWEIKTAGTNRVRLWIDDVLRAQATGTLKDGIWSGNDEGGFGKIGGLTRPAGEPTAAWPVPITGTLRFYDGHLAPAPSLDSHIDRPTYTCDALNPDITIGSMPAVSINAGSNAPGYLFSCECVFPSAFADGGACLFETGGSGSGIYVGVRKEGSALTLRARAGSGSAAPGTDILTVDTTEFPRDDKMHTICIDLTRNVLPGKHRIRLWVDGTQRGQDVGAISIGYFAGPNPGRFGSVNSAITVGESTNPWPAALGQLRIYDGRNATLPTRGAISMKDIAVEYGVPTDAKVYLNSFRPKAAEDASDDMRYVRVEEASDIPETGTISLGTFRGRQRRCKYDITSTEPVVDMTDFVHEAPLETTLFSRSFGGAAVADLQAEGWVFGDPAAVAETSTYIAFSGVDPNKATSPAMQGAEYISARVVWTLNLASMDGDEVLTCTLVDATDPTRRATLSTVSIAVGETSVVVEGNMRSAVAATDGLPIDPRNGVVVELDPTGGIGDSFQMVRFEVKETQVYRAAASANRASWHEGWQVFSSSVGGWHGNDNTYRRGHYASVSYPNDPIDGYARIRRLINGVDLGSNGDWIALRLSQPLLLTEYTVQGDVTELKLFGSNDGKRFDLLHEVEGMMGDDATATLTPPTPSVAYRLMVMLLTRMRFSDNPIWDRGSMNRITYTGTRPQSSMLLEYPPPRGVPLGGQWVKDLNDKVDGTNYAKYKTNVVGQPYGNGEYVAYANTIYAYLDATTYGSDEWPPSGAFDKNAAESFNWSGWHAGTQIFSDGADAATPAVLSIKLPEPIKLQQYSLTPRIEAHGNLQMASKWELQGAICDNGTWSTLDSRSGEAFVDGESRSFILHGVDNVEYGAYRLVIYRNNTSYTSWLSLGEWKLFRL